MGNRTALFLGTRCEFEANNCLPITWLALFDSQDFVVETRRFEHEFETIGKQEITRSSPGLWSSIRRLLGMGKQLESESEMPVTAEDTPYEECEVAVFQTAQLTALERAESAIEKLKARTPVWAYLRPLEILKDELQHCSPDDLVELDVTQFYWAGNPIYGQRTPKGPSSFVSMIESLTGDEQADLDAVNQLVVAYSMASSISSVADLDPEMLMFVLIGTYWGEREELYTLEYFDEAYWTADS